MATKFYAVRRGRNPGLYLKWDDCKTQVLGFSGAEYKSFATKAEALAYLDGASAPFDAPEHGDILTAYVDGSYDAESGRYAYGCVILEPDGTNHELSGIGTDADAAVSRNVAGELLGAVNAVKWAVEHGYDRILICHDYEGIRRWFDRSWKAESRVAKLYVEQMNKFTENIDISFRKIKAHTGVQYNEKADALAKARLGIKK